jgi:three-Cys-motif partner protein
VTEYYSGGGEKTIAKLVILDKYLWSYMSIMENNWSGPKWYVDTHSGTGFTREFGIQIPGSTMRALDHGFDRYYFYEQDDDHFDLLCETLAEEFDLSFDERTLNGSSTRYVACDEPRIRIYNMDSNEGVSWLANEANPNSHWFTFIDPQEMTVERDLLTVLQSRGNMDILYNFQTTGFHRAGAEDADHGHEKVEENVGEDFPIDAGEDEWVEYMKDEVLSGFDFDTTSRKMVSEGDSSWRYDLIFASANGTAEKVMSDIMDTPNLKDDVQEEILQWRQKSPTSQEGLEFYALEVDTHGSSDEEQANLSAFQ